MCEYTTDGCMTINTLCVFGTRPEAIKMAPIIKRLSRDPRFTNHICVTGQHQGLITSILDLFEIAPDFDLNVMVEHQSLGQLTARILEGLSMLFERFRPDCVLVHGDTTTMVTTVMAAYYHKIPVIHVEAGLRTNDNYSPWPEEGNRKMAAALTTLHLAPTSLSRQNLLREGIAQEAIFVTGNTVIDALLDMVDYIHATPHIQTALQRQFSYLSPLRKFILVTGHRRENFGQGFEKICEALYQIAIRFPEVDIIYPVHLNPNVQKPVKMLLGNIDNVFLIDPVDYLSFVYLMQQSYFILTDSGGIQEEAPSLGKPVLLMREKTERPEAVDAGTVLLVGTQVEKIVSQVTQLLRNDAYYLRMSEAANPYGDGQSSARIVEILAEHVVKKGVASVHQQKDQQLMLNKRVLVS